MIFNLQENQYLNKITRFFNYLAVALLDISKLYDGKLISFCFVFLVMLNL